MKKSIVRAKGYVLVSVIVIMAVLVAMMFFFSDALFSEQAISSNQKSATICFHLAEAGVQEAVWRIQNETSTRSAFLNNSSGTLHFPAHTNTLIPNGSYEFDITNTDKAVATITATGHFGSALKRSQRRIIVTVYQATVDAYTEDAGLFVGGPDAGDLYLNNLNLTFGADYDRGGIGGGGDIYIGNSTITLTKDLLANGTITTQNSTINLPAAVPPVPPDTVGIPAGEQQSNYPTTFSLPGIDMGVLQDLAKAQNQYYSSSEFATLIKTKTTFTGVVYVAGSGGIDLSKNHLVINGILASEGSISITNDTLTINHTSAGSGLITIGNFNVNNATVNIEGLVYVGNLAASANNVVITITGGILSHEFSATNITLTINFKKDWINEALAVSGSEDSTVIKTKHWEEEY